MCNVCGINVPAKQKDIVHWHRDSGNLVSFITEMKLSVIFSSGLDKGFIDAGVAIIMDNSLAHYVSKVEEVPSRVVSVQLLFRGKFLASEINSLIAKAVNSSTHVVLGGDFNKNGSGRSASFKFCLGLDLSNSRGVVKTIDYIFVSGSLSFAVAGYQTISVSNFFDTDHRAVMVLISLGELLDFKNTDSVKWAKFRDLSSAKLLSLGDVFSGAEVCSDVDAIWAILQKAVLGSADETFSRHWFSKFRHSKNRHSSKFFGLELLVAKIVKKFCSGGLSDVDLLVSKWLTLNNAKARVFRDLISLDVKSDAIVKHLLLVHKDYRKAKMFELRFSEETSIRKAIDKHMENFCSDKDSMIRSVLDKPFHKIVLNHLVIDDELVLEPEEVKVSVDKIIKRWTRKQSMHMMISDLWARHMGELLSVISDLPDGKAAGLSSIPNELWKQGALFNVCLTAGVVSVLWKKMWVSMIPKPYNWDGVLTNTWPIALIETARKILSKVLFDHISVACSKFNVLQNDNFLVLKGMSTQSLVFAVGLVSIKMCKKFIKFFGSIYENRVNRVITNFGLSGGYKVHDKLDQDEIFSFLLWRIFYDPLLCKVKRHEQGGSGLTSYFSAGAFVDDTIWVGNYVKIAKLSICGQPILIAKKGKAYYYLGIFLSTEGLSKPSVVRAHANVHFFVNIVLKKTITDKQYSYLVSTVLQPIWNVLVRKSLRSKACLLHDFLDAALHHPSLYGLKPFEQVQFKRKMAALIMFSNAFGVLGHLFSHRFLDLQFPIRLHVSLVNNFLAGLVKIFLDNGLSLVNNLSTVFHNPGHFPMSAILGKSLYFDLIISLRCFGVVFGDQLFDKKGDLCGPVPCWFAVSSEFLRSKGFSSFGSADSVELLGLDILGFGEFSAVRDGLHNMWSSFFKVFMDRSLKNFGSTEVASGTAAYFLALDLSSLLLSTMAELQTVALSLECVSSLCIVVLHLDSQAAINACVSEMSLAAPNFHNQCWIERHYIFNLVKMKGHSGVLGNVETDLATGAAFGSPFFLSARVCEHFLVVKGTPVSGNIRYFVRNIFYSVYHAHWEAGLGFNVVLEVMIVHINWVVTAIMWHPDSHMFTGFTSCKFLVLRTYLMKAVYRRLPVAVRKRLYDRHYPGVLCLLYGGVEFSDHSFTCTYESGVCEEILVETSAHWSVLAGVSRSSASAVLQVLFRCSINVGLYALICKGFVLNEWYKETCSVFDDRKVAVAQITDFVKFVVELHHAKVWLVRSIHQIKIEKAGLVHDGSVISGLAHGVFLVLASHM
ncbi:hypothetical protein G9A89_012408 [Geosiphon pyriformis]|nr:hypothetical protein G9A89_012408 [Geosiphon pyriformis]